jgi:two-component system probable response regulator PhcQ
VETYLATALLANDAQAFEPDWQWLDYSDLVAAESARSGTFGHAVAARLGALRSRGAGSGAQNAVAAMAAALEEAGVASRRAGDVLVVDDIAGFAEFLREPAAKAVSSGHAAWLGSLLWLDENEIALEAVREGNAIAFRHAEHRKEFPADRLAAWIEQF